MNPQSAVRHLPSVRAVVFDLDGLMFNTEELYIDVGTELLRRRGKTFSQQLMDRMMGRPSAVALRLMIDEHNLTTTVAELLAESDEIFADILRQRLRPMPGLMELLAALEQHGFPKAIATSSRRSFVERVLKPLELAPRFAFILTSEDITHGKPHPEIYRLAAQRHGVAPAQMLVLEDSQNGCRSAVAAGAIAVAVPGDHSRAHDFSGAALIADSLADERIYALLGLASL